MMLIGAWKSIDLDSCNLLDKKNYTLARYFLPMATVKSLHMIHICAF